MIKTRQISLFLAFTLMLITFFASASTAVQAAPADDLVIVGVIDGPLSGGVPKAVSLYAINAIPDLSVYGIGAANNGGGTDGEEFTFPAVPVPAGTCIYVASEAVGFTNFFGFAPDYTSFAASINGDDAIELFANESVSDIFGDINVDGSGQPWDHVDGWAYRNAGTGPDGSTFTLGNWSFSGINALDGETTNATAATPFPINAYAPCLIVDTAPMVASTVPANSAAAIALDASLEITFNEDVTVTEPWLALVCSTSGIHTTVTTGGPQVYTVNPDSDFVNDETCTATITATQVADQDGTADNLAADVAFTFATESSVALSNLVINEISADPDATNGDANGDGTVSTTQDEFVEIVNINGADIDISGWTLSDAVGVRHTFPIGSVIPDSCSIVVFGAGTPTGTFGGSIAQTASTNTLGLNNTGDTVTLNDGISDVAVYAYGSEGGDNQSLTRDPDITGSDPMVKHTIATGANGALFSPGTQVDGTSFSGCPIAVSLVKIHEVQGSGASSPLTGQMVMIEGVVVGDFQDNDPGNNGDLNGFFVQEEDADADSDPSTSEGVFVFDGSLPAVNVAIGDVVRVVGRVDEFFSLTEIVNVSEVTVISSGNALPTPATVILPISAQSDLEAFEGMSVSFPQSLTIVEYFNFDRFGEIVLATDRLFQPTAVYAPGSVDAINLADANSRSIITLDDGRTASNPDPAIHPNGAVFDLTNSFRGGDLVTNAAGVLHYAFNLYRIHPTQGADYTAVNPRTSDHEPVGGSLEVASFNVLNYFNGDGLGGGFPTSRGADDVAEFARQRDKIVAAMVAIDADVLGLMEIENDGYGSDSAIQDLVNGLNAATAPDTYAIVDPGVATIGTDAIAVGLIYKPATATPQGSSAILDSSVDARFVDTKNRPALAQTFIDNNTGGVFTVAVNHLKSKGSNCDDLGDPDLGDGAGNCNLTRKAAAEALVDWLAGDPTGSGDSDVLIIGDLNSYDKEDPINALINGDYTDLENQFGGEYAYSYVFGGQLGYLDYALANSDLLPEVTGAAAWHINSDEPDLLDYDTTFKKDAQDALYEPNAYRASDHDPIVIGLAVCDEIAPTLSVTVNPDALWPPNHKYVDVMATVIASDNFDQNPTVTLLSVTSNEPDSGQGNGDKPNDIVIVGDTHLKLRAERSGNGTGRIYTITYQVTDACGNSATAETAVTVAHDKGK